MIKSNYYYLIAGLPDIIFGKKNKVISSIEFKKEIKPLLTETDYELAKLLFLENDNKHLLNIQFDVYEANYNWNSNLVEPYSFVLEFLNWAEKQPEPKKRLHFENKLNYLYYSFVLKNNNSFLKNWFLFKLNLKNVLAASNCIKYNIPLKTHLIETNENEEVISMLLKKNLQPKDYEDLIPRSGDIFSVINSKIPALEKELMLGEIVWEFVDDETSQIYFGIEKILAFIIKLAVVERWNNLSEKRGKKMIDKLVSNTQRTYKYSEEFSY